MSTLLNLKELGELVGGEKIVLDQEQLRLADLNNRVYEKAFGIHMVPLPEAIVFATDTDDVVKILKYCNARKINVITRGGGSGSEGLLETHEEGSLMLDVSRMDKMLNFDKYNMMATMQAGYPQDKLESMANAIGLTTGHSPQSRPLALIGGLVATRSIGQFSTYYGGIEDMVCGLEAVMPDGRVIRIRNVPRRSAGPDLKQIFIGSEGALGVITEVTIKLFPWYPDNLWMGGYVLNNMDTGFEAIRDIMVSGYKPSVVRLYDKSDMDHNFGSVKLKNEEAFMFFTAEGPPEIAKGTGEGINRIANKHEGVYIGTAAVEHWMEHRNDICKTIGAAETYRKYRETNIFYATIEISADWTEIKEIYSNVMKNVPEKIKNLVMLGGHISHSYINGTNIYFVYEIKINSPETSDDEQMAFIKALCDEVIKYPTGGVVHHHGMGKQRVIYAEQEHGTSYSIMKDLKKALDPSNIMNRGNLIRNLD